MLPAEFAILVHFKSVGIVLLVFLLVVVALFALCASKYYFNSHNGTSRFTEKIWGLSYTPASLKNRHKKRTPDLRYSDCNTTSTYKSIGILLFHAVFCSF